MAFTSMGNSGKVRALFTLDASTLEAGTTYSVSVGVWENGSKQFSVSAFDLGARSGAWLEARDTVPYTHTHTLDHE